MENLRCVNLKRSFDGVQALAGVTLSFADSGISAIIGPNGAGKTTLFNILTGFLRPDSGNCFLGNRETTNLAPYRISRLGITRTFQDLRLIEQLSTLENVMLTRPHQRGERFMSALIGFGVAAEEAENRRKAIQLLNFVGLEEKAYERAGELSYGQQKLLTLACCLATEAQILLLDEPIAGVSPGMRERILQLLKQLREDGKLIIFVEHDIAAVKDCAENVVVMDEGKVIAEGPPRDILSHPEIIEAYVT